MIVKPRYIAQPLKLETWRRRRLFDFSAATSV